MSQVVDRVLMSCYQQLKTEHISQVVTMLTHGYGRWMHLRQPRAVVWGLGS